MATFTPTGSTNIGTVDNNNPVSTPLVSNQTIVSANTEESVTLPASTIRFRIKARNNSILQLSYAMGTSGTTYWTVYPGTSYDEDNIDNSSGVTLYIQASKPNTVLEIITWT